ncbi:MAG: N-acetylmuramoyl-L-alanine amidase [Oscillospiraceae bacterium]|jgi:N-acetylmuramoyl-L-alanine amidase|nr:N-acetylmuramoyl-L-alanine amidase [Oscillospiraceae bacterium]
MAKRVSIEIGHGGTDPGAVRGKILEKDINLCVGTELKRQLERHGIEVLVNRVSDVSCKVSDFLAKARAFDPNAGISVHANAFDGKAKGFEVFRNTNAFKIVSNLLCADIEARVKSLGQTSRGIKDGNFLMSSLPCPTAYCELGFLDNPDDYKGFDTAEKQKAFAAAYAKGILDYFGMSWLPETSPASPASEASKAPETPKKILYRVVAGSFSERANAEARAKTLKAKGVDCFIAEYVS